LPLNPRKEALNDPPAFLPTQSAAVLRLALLVGTVRRNHLRALGAHHRVQSIAVVRFIADQVLRLRFDHVEVEGQLHEPDLMMVRGVRGHRQRQAVTIDDCHDIHAFFRVASARSRRRRPSPKQTWHQCSTPIHR